jgi:hypothetical protein
MNPKSIAITAAIAIIAVKLFDKFVAPKIAGAAGK